MHHIGDLYHGRSHWVLDRDYNFHHGMGDVVIDLTTAQIMPGNYKIYVKAGIGEVTVRVPDGINVEVEASVGLGELDVFGEQRSGIGGLSLQKEIMLPQAEATVKIEAKLGMGELTISYIPAIPGVIR
jgi:lia operon protein LiaF